MPKGIRPTQNRVRKAIFDILGDVKGLSLLELFAGSGAVGLEALSRGASGVVFVENNRNAQLAINSNIQALKLQNCLLMSRRAEETIPFLHKSGRKFDIIFMDPPYSKGEALGKDSVESLAKKTLQMLGAYDILAPNGFVIVQHFKKDSLPENAGSLTRFRQAAYGDTVLSFYRKTA